MVAGPVPELRPYQDDALDFLIECQGGIYADPPGAGKTATTLRWLEQGELHGSGGKHLIVAPLSVLGHWEREARVWYPNLRIVRGDGTPAKRRAARQEVVEAGRQDGGAAPTALLIHYEGIRQDIKQLVEIRHWDAIVFDEAHRLKGRNTLTSKAAIVLSRRADQVALLTGTPIMNRAEELWSLLRLLDPEAYRSYWTWCHKYFNTELRHFQKSPRPVEIVVSQKKEMLPELQEEVACTLIQRPMSALLPDLPDVVTDMIPVRLNPSERKVYDQLEKHSWAQSEDGDILQVSNEVSKIARQRQLASDFSSLFDGGAPASKAKAAIEVIKDLVEAGEQVVVMCAFKHTANAIIEGVGRALALPYNGDLQPKEREEYLESFRRGAVSVLCGTQATMGEGVDGLQVARHLVMVDRDWTPARNQQAVGRLLRSGQKRTVFVHHLYCEGTIDETVARVCEEKEQMIEMVLG